VVSAQSIHNLTSVFERVARAAILRSPDDSWELVAAAPPAGKGEQLLVITTSSFGFRLLTIFQVPIPRRTGRISCRRARRVRYWMALRRSSICVAGR